MKYYIECTVDKKDPLTGRTIETDVDLSLPYLVDIEPARMNDEWAKARLISEYWEDFAPEFCAECKNIWLQTCYKGFKPVFYA